MNRRSSRPQDLRLMLPYTRRCTRCLWIRSLCDGLITIFSTTSRSTFHKHSIYYLRVDRNLVHNNNVQTHPSTTCNMGTDYSIIVGRMCENKTRFEFWSKLVLSNETKNDEAGNTIANKSLQVHKHGRYRYTIIWTNFGVMTSLSPLGEGREMYLYL